MPSDTGPFYASAPQPVARSTPRHSGPPADLDSCTLHAEPDVLVKQLAADEAIAAADTLILTVPNQLGVDYNTHAIDSILKFVAPELGWR